MSIIITPNMNLPVPVVGSEPGPQYAIDVNSCFNIIDTHNHTSGYGVPITPAAINYNNDLSAMNNRLELAKAVSFTVQGAPLTGILPDIGALYVSGVDLYYNDINGNQIQITQGGGVAGSPGSISGLTPPASASYSVGGAKFIWQSASNTSAGMDNGPITIREEVASAKGITIQSPTALAADYSLTLPGALPGGTSFLTVDASGNIADNVSYPLTRANLGPLGQQISASSGSFTTTSGISVPVTNLSVTITTGGNPVRIELVQAQPVATLGYISASGSQQGDITIFRDATIINDQIFQATSGGTLNLPLSSISNIDVVGAGTYTYSVQAAISGGGTLSINNATLFVYEM